MEKITSKMLVSYFGNLENYIILNFNGSMYFTAE